MMDQSLEAALAAEQTPISPDSELGERFSIDDEIPQGILDLAGGFLSDNHPELKQAEVKEETAEEPEEIEQESSGEDEEILEAEDDDSDEEEQLSEEETDLPDSVVDYDELKEHTLRFRVGDEMREMSIDQIVSELGQVKAASKAQSEVKTRQEEIEAAKVALEEEKVFFENQQKAVIESQELATKRVSIAQAQQALQNARVQGDVNAMVQIKDHLDLLTEDYNTTESRIRATQEQTEQKLLQDQMKKLEEMGYGSLLKDKQRAGALSEYAYKNLSTSAAKAANYDASLLAAVEKARLWDASQTKKGKLKTSKASKTLKSGTGKASTPKKDMSPDEAIYQHALKLMGG